MADPGDELFELAVRERPLDLRKRPPKLNRCGMCNARFSKERPPTKDHVISSCFVSTPAPPNLPTWRVCLPCQQLLAPREERLRNVIASARSRHPERVATVAERAERSRQIIRPDRFELRTSDEGLLVRAGVVDSNQDDLRVVFGKIARGLFYWRHRVPPDPDAPFYVAVPSAEDFRWLSKAFLEESQAPVQRFGWDLWWASASELPSNSLWLFVALGAVPVYVATGKPAEKGRITPPPSPIVLKI